MSGAFIFYSILVILKDDGRIAVVEAEPGDDPLYKIGAYIFTDKDTPMYYFACDKLAYEAEKLPAGHVSADPEPTSVHQSALKEDLPDENRRIRFDKDSHKFIINPIFGSTGYARASEMLDCDSYETECQQNILI